MDKVNYAGRTRKEQKALDDELTKRGSLWPKFDVMYRFVFTPEELSTIENARIILDKFKKKCQKYFAFINKTT